MTDAIALNVHYRMQTVRYDDRFGKKKNKKKIVETKNNNNRTGDDGRKRDKITRGV